MKIGPKHHTISTGPTSPREGSKLSSISRNFESFASFKSSGARSLKGRVAIQKKGAKKLTKLVQSITRGVPTPFIK